ncbi:sensor histidine kinase [Dinghuibacter silviterrae]|uniref:Histidine kinase n=1 Tax=Dinghuibacter silviterrae TaxID=1539049 RepID=A0A4R8DR71_9BACT|nr:histidine kinase [Dinghuibacter silviterrae]TDW99914.1 histidine kinase [Dinghuibacter silviterrae]
MKKDRNLFVDFLVERKYSIYRHTLLIIVLLFVVFNGRGIGTSPPVWSFRVIFPIFNVSLFYVNVYVLIPRFLWKNKYSDYFLIVLGLVMFAAVTVGLGRYWIATHYRLPIPPEKEFNPFKFSFWMLTLMGVTTSFKFFQRWVFDTERINELERLTRQSELAQLKNQINPHFLFNMLNNANVLTHKDPEKASQVLMKLSDLLRYQLYDSARDKVLLTADIRFLHDFLNLEKTRRDNFDFLISQEGELSGVQIPPLLFTTFVENAVKHSVAPEGPSYVHLYFSLHASALCFRCVNSKPAVAASKGAVGGLGLTNIRRTLDLLYPGKYRLEIRDVLDAYSITLNLEV